MTNFNQQPLQLSQDRWSSDVRLVDYRGGRHFEPGTAFCVEDDQS